MAVLKFTLLLHLYLILLHKVNGAFNDFNLYSSPVALTSSLIEWGEASDTFEKVVFIFGETADACLYVYTDHGYPSVTTKEINDCKTKLNYKKYFQIDSITYCVINNNKFFKTTNAEDLELSSYNNVVSVDILVQNAKSVKFIIIYDDDEFYETTNLWFKQNILTSVSSFLGNVNLFKSSILFVTISNNDCEKISFKPWIENIRNELIEERKLNYSRLLTNTIKLLDIMFYTNQGGFSQGNIFHFYNCNNDCKKYDKSRLIQAHRDMFYYCQSKIPFSKVINNHQFGLINNQNNYKVNQFYYYKLRNQFYLQICELFQEDSNCFDKNNLLGINNIKIFTSSLQNKILQNLKLSDSISFCENVCYVLHNFNMTISDNLSKLCNRIEFLDNYLGIKHIFHAFINMDLVNIYFKCYPEVDILQNKYNVDDKNSHMEFYNDFNLKTNLEKNIDIQNIIQSLESYDLQKNMSNEFDFSTFEVIYLSFRIVKPHLNMYKYEDYCIFEGDVLSLTLAVEESYECNNIVILANNAVFLDESREKVTNLNIKNTLQIISPKWIQIGEYFSFTNLFNDILGLGITYINDTDIYNITNVTVLNGFEFQINNKIRKPLLLKYHINLFLQKFNTVNKNGKMFVDFVTSKMCEEPENNLPEALEDLQAYLNMINETNFEIMENCFICFEKFIEKYNSSFTNDLKIVYLHILLAYKTKASSLKPQSTLITDLSGYFNTYEKKLDEFTSQNKEKKHVESLEVATLSYTKILNDRITECLHIGNNFSSKLKQLLENNEEYLKLLASELSNMEERIKYQRDTLIAKRKDLVLRSGVSIGLGIISAGASLAAAFFGPAGILVTNTIAGVAKIGVAASFVGVQEYDNHYTVPQAIFSDFEEIKSTIMNSKNIEINNLEAEIIDLNSTVTDLNITEKHDLQKILITLYNTLQSNKNNQSSDSFMTVVDVRKQLDDFLNLDAPKTRIRTKRYSNYLANKPHDNLSGPQELAASVGAMKDNSESLSVPGPSPQVSNNDEVFDTELAGVEKGSSLRDSLSEDSRQIFITKYQEISTGFSRASTTIASSIGSIDRFMKDIPSSAEIEKSEKDLNQISKVRADLFLKTLIFIEKYNINFENIANNLKSISKPMIIELKYLIKRQLKDMKKEFQKLSQGLNVNKLINENIEELQEILSAMLDIYSEMEKYRHEKEFVQYLKEINTPVMQSEDIENKTLQSIVNNLRENVSSFVLYRDFQKLLHNFQQWVFPFAPHFLNQFKIYDTLIKQIDVSPIVLKNTFINIKSKYDNYKNNIIEEIDQHLFKASFYSYLNSSQPFVSWKRSSFNTEITNLLLEKTVTIRASIPNKNDMSENAIKFRIINLNFRCDNDSVCKKLRENLSFYNIELTHMGQSHYRCNDQFYTIYSASQKIMYSYEMKDGIPVRKNIIYDKMENGDLLLSPYTIWKLKLTPIRKDNSNLLGEFINHVDLELVGEGQYVRDDNVEICSSELKNYYQHDD